MKRRTFLESASGVAALVAFRDGHRAWTTEGARGWRTFEVTTRLEILDPPGVTRAWVPLPLMADTDYQKRLGDTWDGNANAARIWRDERYDAGILCAEWPASVKAPMLQVLSRFATLDRAVDRSKPCCNGMSFSSRAAHRTAVADPSLAQYLEPTKLLPTDGIVAQTARDVTQGKVSPVDKARAIYEWIVENTFRDPTVGGCGTGDIKTMLETGYLGGKCADLNALFVGLARAAAIPARAVFGLRVAESKEFKSLGRAGDVTKAQHCRSEFHDGVRWVPVDPADVRKVVLEEPHIDRTLDDPVVQQARRKLFGAWEMNYVAYNHAQDLTLPGASGSPVPFLMYPQCETAAGRKDSVDATAFRYAITAREV